MTNGSVTRFHNAKPPRNAAKPRETAVKHVKHTMQNLRNICETPRNPAKPRETLVKCSRNVRETSRNVCETYAKPRETPVKYRVYLPSHPPPHTHHACCPPTLVYPLRLAVPATTTLP